MRFLDNCVKDDEVKRRTEQGESILTLCNYEKYNVKVDADSSTDDSALIIYNQENIIKERAPMTAPMTAPTAANNKKEKNVKKENNVGVDEISNFEEKISNSDVQFPKKEKSCAKKEKDDDNGFEKVWALYERKGNRKTSERKWANLKNHCREAALKHIPLYVASTPDKQYRKNFETYINQECWNDEILERKQVTPPPAEPYVVNIKPINDDE
ncbi:MAG: hypothetical protein LBF69_05285 [Prevotellaceae bacterium]|nr:hypothetical protein [Prevotellaceae bacterium]